ncbi:MAG: DUF5362 family protein [Bacillota bacterium]|nr:DUF5362 family protein [Bacillota bacterium]
MEDFNNSGNTQNNSESEAVNPENQNSNKQNQGYQNPSYQNPGYQNPGYQNNNYQGQGYQNPHYQNPGYQNPGYNPNYQNMNYQTPPVNPGFLYSLSLSGWATFIGVLTIIIGALMCIGSLINAANPAYAAGAIVFNIIIGLGLGITLIFGGINLLNATDAMKKFLQFRDFAKVAEAFKKLNLYFMILGIAALIFIVLFIIALIIGISALNISHYNLNGF